MGIIANSMRTSRMLRAFRPKGVGGPGCRRAARESGSIELEQSTGHSIYSKEN